MSNSTSTAALENSTENRGPELIAVTGAFLGLTWFSVLLRFYVRLRITNSFQADDWLMLISIAIFTVNGIFFIVSVHYGLGRHNLSLPQDARTQALKYQALAVIMYIADMAFIKASIAVFLLRIAVRKRYKWILKISMVAIAFWAAGIFLFNIFQCSPVASRWDFTIANRTCVSRDSLAAAAYALSILAVLSDWLYALLPIPMLWNVKMNFQTKISVTFVLSLGVLASIATLIRVKCLIGLSSFQDILFSTVDAEIWTVVEPGLSITAASIVTLRPFLRALNISGFSGSDTYASDYTSRTPHGNENVSRRNTHGYVRSRELNDLPLQGVGVEVRTLVMRNDGTRGLSPPLEETMSFGLSGGQIGRTTSKANEILGRRDEMSDAGSEDFIVHLHSMGGFGTEGGIRRTDTVTIEHEKA